MTTREKFSRKDLKQPDEFLTFSERALDFCRTNQKGLIYSVTVLLVVISIIGVFVKNREVQSHRMENMLHQIQVVQSKGEGPEAIKKLFGQFSEGIQKRRAKLMLADAYFMNKELENSIKLYQEVLGETQNGDLLNELARIGLAYSYEQNNQNDKAIQGYKSLIDGTVQLPLFNIYLSLARVYLSQQDKNNALLILREMKTKYQEHAQIDRVIEKIKKLES